MITWEELDRLRYPEDIADLLRARGIKGVVHDMENCPLALATGCPVGHLFRYNGRCREMLTPAEFRFVRSFDYGDFPDLIKE